MCGIAGIVNFKRNLVAYKGYNTLLVQDMAECFAHSGTVCLETWVGEHAAFSLMQTPGKNQLITRIVEGYEFIITYTGTLYNATELKTALSKFGYIFSTATDAEILLYAYVHYGTACAKKCSGAFVFCIWDSMRQQVFGCRDHCGIQPFYYTTKDRTFLFSSEIKSLFHHPAISPEIEPQGLQRLFLGLPDTGIFKGISELPGGHYMILSRTGLVIKPYWTLEPSAHASEEALEQVRKVVEDDGAELTDTQTPCHETACNSAGLERLLSGSLHCTDLPGLIEWDCALMQLLEKGAGQQTIFFNFLTPVSLIGKAQSTSFATFEEKISGLMHPIVAETLDLKTYARTWLSESSAVLSDDNPEFRTQLYCTLTTYLPYVLQRMNRLAAAYGVELRHPYCDHRLIEAVWNLPREVLESADFSALFPPALQPPIIALVPVKDALRTVLEGRSAPLLAFIKKENLAAMLDQEDPDSNASALFYGYLLQLNNWFKIYNPRLR